jgi:hypothetical protein
VHRSSVSDVLNQSPSVALSELKKINVSYTLRQLYKRYCYSASSERKLLLHKMMCIVISAVVIALCRAIRVVRLHDVSMIAIGVEGADQGEEEPSHHHVVPGMSLPHEPSQIQLRKRL